MGADHREIKVVPRATRELFMGTLRPSRRCRQCGLSLTDKRRDAIYCDAECRRDFLKGKPRNKGLIQALKSTRPDGEGE